MEKIDKLILNAINMLDIDTKVIYACLTRNGNIFVENTINFPDYIFHAWEITNETIRECRINYGKLQQYLDLPIDKL